MSIKKYLLNIQKKIVYAISPSYRLSSKIELLFKQHILNQHIDHRLEQKIRAMALHQKTFSKYKNINYQKDIVLLATGPSLQYFQPIDGAIYIGVNTSFQYSQVKLDYYFAQDYTGMKAYIDDLGAYQGNNTKKFYGILDEAVLDISTQIPEAIANTHGAERYYCKYCKGYVTGIREGENFHPFTFPHDISLAPLGDYGSVVFSALQFALYTNPQKLYLVGCDCNRKGYFNSQQKTQLDVGAVIFGYHQLKRFAMQHYPHTEIISVNPVGLKGLFTDLHTEGWEVDAKKQS